MLQYPKQMKLGDSIAVKLLGHFIFNDRGKNEHLKSC